MLGHPLSSLHPVSSAVPGVSETGVQPGSVTAWARASQHSVAGPSSGCTVQLSSQRPCGARRSEQGCFRGTVSVAAS